MTDHVTDSENLAEPLAAEHDETEMMSRADLLQFLFWGCLLISVAAASCHSLA